MFFWILLVYIKCLIKGIKLKWQIVLWVAIPSLLEKGSVTVVMTIFLIIFLFQYLPKIYHSVCLLRRMQNLSGYIFGTVWWGIALNMIAYFVASHVSSPFLKNFFFFSLTCVYNTLLYSIFVLSFLYGMFFWSETLQTEVVVDENPNILLFSFSFFLKVKPLK